MRLRMTILVIVAGILSLGMLSDVQYKISKQGCAGSGCHTYKPGFMSLKKQDNLRVKVLPQFTAKESAISAELLSSDGKMVDFQEVAAGKDIVLKAPNPGKYKVIVGYQLAEPAWDSLSVTLAPSMINIPTSRYGTTAFKFFPIHPNPVTEGALLRFLLPEESFVQMTLFTLGGRKVRSIYKGRLAGGLHQIHFEARDLAKRPLEPGNYLCELRSGSRSLVQKIVVKPRRAGSAPTVAK